MGTKYRCEFCGEENENEDFWDEEKAWAEAMILWTLKDLDHVAIVCDDCFKAMTAAYSPAEFYADQERKKKDVH